MIRRVRILGAALALTLGGAASAAVAPAHAAPAPGDCGATTPSASLDAMSYSKLSPTGDTARTGPDVPVAITFTNTAEFLGRPFNVTSISARLIACDPNLQALPQPPESTVTQQQGSSLTLSWTPPPFTTNGQYVVEFVGAGDRPTNGGTQRSVVRAPFALAVPPQRPADVKAATDDAGKVTVSWSLAGQEPDVGGYLVQRAAQGSTSLTDLGTVNYDVTKFVDDPREGTWKYQVVALRAGASPTSDPLRSAPAATTAEVAAPPTTTAPDGAATTSTTTKAGTGSATSGSATTRPAAGTTVSGGTRTTVDLSAFASSLQSRRTTATTVRRPPPPDPGFSETLPFDTTARDLEEPGADEPAELGADAPALGQRPVADPGERQRSLGFVAGGLLLFVLGMTGLFLKSEVKRADELDPLDVAETEATAAPAPLPEPAPEPETVAVAPALPARRDARARARAERREAEAAYAAEAHFADLAEVEPAPAAPRPARVRRTMAPLDDPALDVPDPGPASRAPVLEGAAPR